MRRVGGLILLFLSISLSVQALSWAYTFVVFDGKVYEVLNTSIAEEKIGQVIGEVETSVNDETGRYYGNASNWYPIGTVYREVKGESVEVAIAVEDGGEWKRAEYRNEAPYHTRDFISIFGYVLLGIVVLVIASILLKRIRS